MPLSGQHEYVIIGIFVVSCVYRKCTFIADILVCANIRHLVIFAIVGMILRFVPLSAHHIDFSLSGLCHFLSLLEIIWNMYRGPGTK